MMENVNDFRRTAPTPGPPRPYHFPEVTRFVLDNGLRVRIAPLRNAPLVAVQVVIHSGGDRDPQGRVGLASVTADMLDEGTTSRSSLDIASEIGELGASLGTGADWDASYISLDVLARNAEKAVEILSDVLLHPAFDPAELERIRKDRLTTIRQNRDEPGVIASERFSQFVYAGTPYSNPLMGTEQSMREIQSEEIRQFYQQHYLPQNCSLLITGDVGAEEAREMAERFFGGWESRERAVAPPIEPRELDASAIYLVDRPQAVQSEIRIGHIGVPRSTEDYFPIMVMNAILGGVFTSRLNLNLRERKGYTYHVRSTFHFRRHAGPFVVGTAVRTEVTAEAVKEILYELRQIRSGDVQDSELEEVRNYLTGVFPATVQTASDLAHRLQEMELYDLPTDYFDSYRERIAEVTAEDLTRVARTYLNPDKLAIVIVGKARDVETTLAALETPLGLYDISGQPIAK